MVQGDCKIGARKLTLEKWPNNIMKFTIMANVAGFDLVADIHP